MVGCGGARSQAEARRQSGARAEKGLSRFEGDVDKNIARDRRQYVRMDTVFPVEVRVGALPLLQAFTRDVSSGGMCLELKSFGKKTEELILTADAALELFINTPFAKY